jgi:hypothetical protein
MSTFDLPGDCCTHDRRVVRSVREAVPRRTLVTVGTITATRTYVTAHGGRDHVCEVDDGTGRVWLRFVGRRAVAGLVPGACVAVEGTVRVEGTRLVVWNPLYRIRAGAGDA